MGFVECRFFRLERLLVNNRVKGHLCPGHLRVP